MNLRKEIAYLILEILFCIFIIFYGYYIWNNYDLSKLEIAKSYKNDKNIIVNIEDISNIVISNDENNIESNILYLHNTSSNNNSAKLILKINKDNELFKRNTILKIDQRYYDLSNLKCYKDKNFIYIIIDNYNFNSYETKELEVKILSKDQINNNISEYMNYEFIIQL